MLSVYDLLQLSGVVAFIFYLLFIRSQFLRVEQVTGHYNVLLVLEVPITQGVPCACVWQSVDGEVVLDCAVAVSRNTQYVALCIFFTSYRRVN